MRRRTVTNLAVHATSQMFPNRAFYLYTGALNKVFDQGEDFLTKGFNSIKRIGSGIQNAVNSLAGGVLGGLNRAHQEKKKAIDEAVLSEYSDNFLVIF